MKRSIRYQDCDDIAVDRIRAVGGRSIHWNIIHDNPEPSGFASHETGTARMGKDPRTSVLNSNCQAHEVKNLFVVDGSCFTTSPEKNPTLTIMALAARTAHHMAAEVKKGNL